MTRIKNTLDDMKRDLYTQSEKIDETIASSEAIEERIREFEDNLISEFQDFKMEVRSGFYELACLIGEGFRELSYQMSLQSSILEEIKELISKPLDTLSRELRERALDAYNHGWIEEAEKDLLIAKQKNYQDFIVHHTLGNIYFYHKKDLPKAIDCYKNAVKYAEPRSAYHTADALIHAALVSEKMSELNKAYKFAQRAKSLLEEEAWVLYHYSRFSGIAGNLDEFNDSLRKCTELDAIYLVVADLDPSLQQLKNEIHHLATELCQKEEDELGEIIRRLEEAKKLAISIGVHDSATNQMVDSTLNDMKEWKKKGSYLDLRKARNVGKETLDELGKNWINAKEKDIEKNETNLTNIKSGNTHYTWGCLPSILIWLLLFSLIMSVYSFKPEMVGPVDIYQITYRGGVYWDLNGDRTRTYPRGHVFEVVRNEGGVLCLREPKEGWRYCWEGVGRNQLLEGEVGTIGSGEIPDYSKTLSGWNIFFLIFVSPFIIWFICGQIIRYGRTEYAEQKLFRARSQLRELEKAVSISED